MMLYSDEKFIKDQLKDHVKKDIKLGILYKFVGGMDALVLDTRNGKEFARIDLIMNTMYELYKSGDIPMLDQHFKEALITLITKFHSEFGYLYIIQLLNYQLYQQQENNSPFKLDIKELLELLKSEIVKYDLYGPSKFVSGKRALDNIMYSHAQLESKCQNENVK